MRSTLAILCSAGVSLSMAAGGYPDPSEYITQHSVNDIAKEAERGSVTAQSALGYLYLIGEKVPQDDIKAAFYLDKASAAGDAYSAFQLANLYLVGQGVPKNIDEAKRLLRIAADSGDQGAQAQLARLLLQNTTNKADWEYLSQVANRGNVEVMMLMADALMSSEPKEQNLRHAFQWYKKAADEGNDRAQLMVARCLWHGFGVDPDRASGVKYYRKAIDSGSLEAEEELSGLEPPQ